MSFTNPGCPPGQRYSMVLQKCVPDTSGASNDVAINQGDTGSASGGFFLNLSNNIGNWASAFATVNASLRGQTTPETVVIHQPVPEENKKTGAGAVIAIIAVIVVFILLLALILKRRK